MGSWTDRYQATNKTIAIISPALQSRYSNTLPLFTFKHQLFGLV